MALTWLPAGHILFHKKIFKNACPITNWDVVEKPFLNGLHQIKMVDYIKKPPTNIFIGETGCGKTHLVLELIEKEYNKHFGYIIIICPTLRENDTYYAKEWIKNNDQVWLVDPKDNLYQWIKKLSELLRFLEVLFIIDDIIANESLDKRRQPLLELTILGRHRGHYLWLVTQSYSAIPKKLRRQAKDIFVWYSKERP